jgi:hypothetical protein
LVVFLISQYNILYSVSNKKLIHLSDPTVMCLLFCFSSSCVLCTQCCKFVSLDCPFRFLLRLLTEYNMLYWLIKNTTKNFRKKETCLTELRILPE